MKFLITDNYTNEQFYKEINKIKDLENLQEEFIQKYSQEKMQENRFYNCELLVNFKNNTIIIYNSYME